MDRLLLFSADCHAGPKPEQYGPYLEEAYHDDLEQYLAERRARDQERRDREASTGKKPDRAEDMLSASTFVDVSGTAQRIVFATELDKRIPALEADGFVGEVLFPDGSLDNEIPFSGMFGGAGKFSHDQHHAALRAYNRWLGGSCEPGRQIGLGLVPLDDPDYAVAQVLQVHELGLRGVYPEWDAADASLPALWDSVYDPFWDACVDQELAVHFHAGSGVPSGFYERPGQAGPLVFTFECMFWARRPLWHMVFGGVLERHPGLRVTWVETWADWVPRVVKQLDYQWAVWDYRLPGGIKELCPLPPSEYWRRQCAIGVHSPSILELELRDEFPLETMMYGTDFPHSGSPWGLSNEYLQATLGATGFTEDEARAFLGGNAVRWYDLDVKRLEAIADRIGPTPEEIIEPDPTVMEKLTFLLQKKVGRPASV